MNSIGGLSENADESEFFIAFLHSIKVWRVRNVRHKNHPRVTVASGTKFSPEFTHQVPKMTRIGGLEVAVRRAHLAEMPLRLSVQACRSRRTPAPFRLMAAGRFQP